MTNELRTGTSYTFCLSDLPKLDLQVDKGTDFAIWCLQWTSYCSLSGLSREVASKQVEALSLFFKGNISNSPKPRPHLGGKERRSSNYRGTTMIRRRPIN